MLANKAEEKSKEKMWTSFLVERSVKDKIQSMGPYSKKTGMVSSLILIFYKMATQKR